MRKYFGTDGIRGLANSDPMTVENALRLGRAVAFTFGASSRSRPKILVGKDTRLSGYMLESALVAGITSTGADVILLGPIPTPGIAYLTTSMRAEAGIVISASHNPYEDNGLKVFGHDGFKLPDDVEAALELRMESELEHPDLARGADIGRARRIEDANGRYITHLKALLHDTFDLDGLRIVVDCANGAGYRAAPAVFEELGAEVIPLGVHPNGLNINASCGSLHPECCAEAVRRHGADLGVALDGDADRLILLDERGDVVDGDAILALCGLHLHQERRLRGPTVVATVMSNLGLEHALASEGVGLVRTAVGDRYVVQHMRETGLNFGGEQSGHLVFLDHATTGDGIAAAIQVLNVMLSRQRPLSELSGIMQRVPQVLVNRAVSSKRPVEELPASQALMANLERSLAGRGRLLVRYSGTESKIRVMVEGEDEARIREMAEDLADTLVKELDR